MSKGENEPKETRNRNPMDRRGSGRFPFGCDDENEVASRRTRRSNTE